MAATSRTSTRIVVCRPVAELLLLEDSEQLRLKLQRKVSDLVEEERAPWASSKRPAFWAIAPVNAPFSCPNSSLSSRSRGNGGAIHFDQSLAASGTEVVQSPRHQLYLSLESRRVSPRPCQGYLPRARLPRHDNLLHSSVCSPARGSLRGRQRRPRDVLDGPLRPVKDEPAVRHCPALMGSVSWAADTSFASSILGRMIWKAAPDELSRRRT